MTEDTARRTVIVVALASLLALLLFAFGCGTNPPTPDPPGPVPTDAFAGQLFDCRLGVVLVERSPVTAPVSACLVAVEVAPCLLGLLGQFAPASIACLVRDVGADATAKANAGSPDPQDFTRASNARDWISNHQLGYR